jgi:hypothetical protein
MLLVFGGTIFAIKNGFLPSAQDIFCGEQNRCACPRRAFKDKIKTNKKFGNKKSRFFELQKSGFNIECLITTDYLWLLTGAVVLGAVAAGNACAVVLRAGAEVVALGAVAAGNACAVVLRTGAEVVALGAVAAGNACAVVLRTGAEVVALGAVAAGNACAVVLRTGAEVVVLGAVAAGNACA